MIPTNEKVKIENYPYGFNLRTTMFDYMEFDSKKGYRHCTQTINPKTGGLNNPKKSTYYPLLVRYWKDVEEKSHDKEIKNVAFDFNGDESINKGCKFVAENFDIFSLEEKKYLYNLCYAAAASDMRGTAMYGGSKIEDLKPLYEDFFAAVRQGIQMPEINLFGSLKLDTEKIEETKPKDFSPFK